MSHWHEPLAPDWGYLFEELCCLFFFSYFLRFCIGIGASEIKSLVGGFNQLKSFNLSVVSVVAGLDSDGFSPLDWCVAQ
jgi:hypothetical protein